MRGGSSRRDIGASSVEYAALILVASTVIAILAGTGVLSAMIGQVEGAICRLFTTDDAQCADEQPVARPTPSPSETPAEGQAGSAPRFFVPPGGQLLARPVSDTDEPECKATNAYGGLGDLEAFCGGFYEIDLNFQGGRVYLYQEVTALLAGGVYDVCDKLADSDQQLGRCLLAFLSSFEVDDQYEDHWEKYTQGRRWEDFLGEIREVQRAARFDESECLTVDGKRGPFGSTNWTTRGSDNKHCQAGPDLLEELRESDPELDDALGNDFDLNEWLPDQIPENGDLSDVEALLDRLEDYGLGLADIGLDRDRLIDGLSEALQPWERTQNCYVLVICDPPQDFVEEDD